ncbi:MAG: F0F1 ATP synthase subunit gamma [Thermodesulfobacteriota bacterium]
METIEDLKRRIESTEDLQSVVKTMKAMAAVKIRQFEKAVESLGDYNRTVEMGFQIALRSRPDITLGAGKAPKTQLGAIIFGSDQGMCGQLNDQIVSYALRNMDEFEEIEKEHRLVLSVGQRARGRLEDAGQPVEKHISVPGSVRGIVPKVQDLVTTIQAWNTNRGLDQVFLYYSKPLSGSRYRQHSLHLLPVDKAWLERMREKSWPTKMLPQFTMDWDPLFSALIRQYLFISLFRAFAESLASENASRLASMQGAEKNIQDQLSELTMQYHQQRQMSITEELLDIVSGFEALKQDSDQ